MTFDFVPRLPSGTIVNDFRFSHGKADVPPITFVDAAAWPTVTQAKSHRGYNVTQEDWEKIQ
jgi:hypothetical protein